MRDVDRDARRARDSLRELLVLAVILGAGGAHFNEDNGPPIEGDEVGLTGLAGVVAREDAISQVAQEAGGSTLGARAEPRVDLGRQTGGSRLVVSLHAVFDADLHRVLSPARAARPRRAVFDSIARAAASGRKEDLRCPRSPSSGRREP